MHWLSSIFSKCFHTKRRATGTHFNDTTLFHTCMDALHEATDTLIIFALEEAKYVLFVGSILFVIVIVVIVIDYK